MEFEQERDDKKLVPLFSTNPRNASILIRLPQSARREQDFPLSNALVAARDDEITR